MPRRARVRYENASCYVMNRGRGRRWIFHGDEYYEAFLLTSEEAHEWYEAKIHAYCLMRNLYHLLAETPLANLDRVMRHIFHRLSIFKISSRCSVMNVERWHPERVWVYRQPVDMRKSIDGVSAIVTMELGRNPSDHSVYVFCNRAKDKVKLLIWHRNGFWLLYKRLEKKRFYGQTGLMINR